MLPIPVNPGPRVRAGLAACLGAAVCLAGGVGPWAAAFEQDRPDVPALLDRYERGDHADVVLELARTRDPATLRRDLERQGTAWTEAAGAGLVVRRRMVAATVALEFAALRLWPEDVDPLIEWGCGLVRRNGAPNALERLWQRASVAIFGRARDAGKLVTRAGPGVPQGTLITPESRRVDHIGHARARFPDEPRFRLAAAMLAAAAADTEPPRDAEWVGDGLLPKDAPEARRRTSARRAIDLLAALTSEPELGAEAEMRLGYLRLTLEEPDRALAHFARAATASDPFVAYLGRFLAGRAHDRQGDRDRANQQYRAALAVLPGAQSATTALSANLFLGGRPDEAYGLTQRAIALRPPPDDPWHQFGYGDLRFVPALLGGLRGALR